MLSAMVIIWGSFFLGLNFFILSLPSSSTGSYIQLSAIGTIMYQMDFNESFFIQINDSRM